MRPRQHDCLPGVRPHGVPRAIHGHRPLVRNHATRVSDRSVRRLRPDAPVAAARARGTAALLPRALLVRAGWQRRRPAWKSATGGWCCATTCVSSAARWPNAANPGPCWTWAAAAACFRACCASAASRPWAWIHLRKPPRWPGAPMACRCSAAIWRRRRWPPRPAPASPCSTCSSISTIRAPIWPPRAPC